MKGAEGSYLSQECGKKKLGRGENKGQEVLLITQISLRRGK